MHAQQQGRFQAINMLPMPTLVLLSQSTQQQQQQLL
jgi:hypothetical protein